MYSDYDKDAREDGRYAAMTIASIVVILILMAVALSWRECAGPPSGPPPVPADALDAAAP